MLRISRFCKPAIVVMAFMSSACTTFDSKAKDSGLIVSTIELSGSCLSTDIEFNAPVRYRESVQPGAEAVTEALLLIAAESLVNAGISFVADWMKGIEDDQKGADSASNIGAFYCRTDNNKLGVRDTITYKRVALSGDDSTPQIEIVSKLEYYVSPDKTDEGAITGLFAIRPDSIKYRENIAKRGTVKDVTVTYSFGFLDEEGNVSEVAADPFVFKSIQKGETAHDELGGHLGAKLVGTLPDGVQMFALPISGDSPASVVTGPFRMKIDVAETAVGNGEILAAEIAKSIGESLEEDQDSLAEKILDDWFDLKEEEEGEGDDGES